MSVKLLLRPFFLISSWERMLTVGGNLPIRTLKKIGRSGGIILWDHEGEWGLISREQIAAAIQRYETLQKKRKHYPLLHYENIQISFLSTTSISAAAVRVLR